MNTLHKNIKVLSIVLAVQAVLAVILWQTGGRAPGQAPRLLLGLDEAAITALEITAKPASEGKPAETVKLVKNGADWVVASHGDYPAKKEKVDEVVKKLATIKVRTPIATQASNHNTLRVGKDNWGKEVMVTAGAETKKLVIGTGSGSAINIRFADQDDVFQGRGVTEYQVSNTARTYVETAYVKAETDKVSSVVVTNSKGTLTFRKEAGKWALEELPVGAELDETKVNGFVSGVARMNLDRPSGKEIKPEMNLDAGVKVRIMATEADKPVTFEYTIGGQAGAAEDDGFYVKSKDSEFVVISTKWATEAARIRSADEFVKKPEAAENGPGPGGLPPGMGGLPPGMGGMPPGGFMPPEE